MRKTILAMLAAALSILSSSASSQSMIEAPMSAQTQMHIDGSGRVSSCGMRVMGFHDAGDVRHIFDGSITIRTEGRGFGKLAGMTGSSDNSLDRLKMVDIYGGWFRKQGGSPTMPLSGYMPGEDPKTKLFIADMEPTLEVLEAIATQQPIHISISWREGNSTIYYGTPELEDSQKNQFWQCFDDLAKAMKDSLQ